MVTGTKANKLPTKDALNVVNMLGLKVKVKKAKENIRFEYINTEASTFKVVAPTKNMRSTKKLLEHVEEHIHKYKVNYERDDKSTTYLIVKANSEQEAISTYKRYYYNKLILSIEVLG